VTGCQIRGVRWVGDDSNCWVRTELWDGALSWWSSQVRSRRSSGRRLRTFPRSWRKTVWPVGTGASRYHNCCIDGDTSSEYFGYHLVLQLAGSSPQYMHPVPRSSALSFHTSSLPINTTFSFRYDNEGVSVNQSYYVSPSGRSCLNKQRLYTKPRSRNLIRQHVGSNIMCVLCLNAEKMCALDYDHHVSSQWNVDTESRFVSSRVSALVTCSGQDIEIFTVRILQPCLRGVTQD
jgi:hypothetical protein